MATKLIAEVTDTSTFDGPIGTRLVGENEWSRFWELILAPGQRMPFHEHRHNYYWVIHQGATVRVGYTDGTSMEWDHQAGEVTFIRLNSGPAIHDLTNIGQTTLVASTIELLKDDDLFWRPEGTDLV